MSEEILYVFVWPCDTPPPPPYSPFSFSLGGLIQSLRWDPLGERLAISFQVWTSRRHDSVTSNTLFCNVTRIQDSDAVALFCTSESPTLTLSPIGLIRGTDDGERPSCMEFAGSAFDEGAMLTIVCQSLQGQI